ncbi:MAG: chemotaxis protein CheA [Spirochaetales bacterium]|nr:chemotaxis protein CheA [Spirochaetales bacterium]
MNENYFETFKDEACELIDKLEKICLDIEPSEYTIDQIQEIFRILHTIKGTSAMFGFQDISDFVHKLESLYSEIRNNERALSAPVISLTISAADCIRATIEASTTSKKVPEVLCRHREKIISSVEKLLQGEEIDKTAVEDETTTLIPESHITTMYRIRFTPPGDIFLKGINPEAILKELDALGTSRVIARLDEIPELSTINPESCYLSWDILLSAKKTLDEIRDIFIFVEDQSAIRIDIIGTITEDEDEISDAGYKRLGEILLERGDISPKELTRALDSQKRLGEALVESKAVEKQKVLSALAEQDFVKQQKQQQAGDMKLSSIRVKAERLDELINLVGELVTLQARLRTTVHSLGDSELQLISEESERLVEDLRTSAMGMRMLSVDFLFGKIKRLVYDLSRELKKRVDLFIEGAETELDKSVIERLNDPLVHLIRNCIDHGIEPEEERRKKGKPVAGKITLRAYHAEATVFIEIQDDGQGLDAAKIRKKAEMNKIIEKGALLSESELLNLVFLPGFSTAQEVSKVSGRGVGMDVVKRTVESLGGQVRITSEKDKGTTITLKIPLTLSIIEGLFIKVAGDMYVIPLSLVEEVVELEHETAQFDTRRHLLPVRGEMLPYIRLREYFDIDGDIPHFEKIVVVNAHRRIGLAVDDVAGNAQVVIKSLGSAFAQSDGVLGATVTGDGKVSLILDIGRITTDAIAEETQRVNQQTVV